MLLTGPFNWIGEAEYKSGEPNGPHQRHRRHRCFCGTGLLSVTP